MSDSTAVETLSVKIRSADLIKVNVEGFELPVAPGSQGFFEKASRKPPIICEAVPSAYSKLGSLLRDLNAVLERYDYRSYDPTSLKVIDVTTLSGTTDVLFLSP
jgi:hypothetical protein